VFWLLAPATLLVLAGFAYPLFWFLLKAFTDPQPGLGNFRAVLGQPLYGIVLGNTVSISAATTALALLLGYPYAYTLAQTHAQPRLRRLLVFCVLIPFWTSILVRTFAWMVLLQPKGLVNEALMGIGLLRQPAELIFNRTGLLIGMVQIQLPFMIFPLYSVMSKIDPVYASAAANLGASPVGAFWRVYLPLSLPGVFTGCMLVFVTCLGYFVAPELLGGRRDTMVAQLIQQQVSDFGNWGVPAVLSIILLIGTGLVLAIARRGAARLGV
jgi:putative spermidine/putrescine transport system permease protein